MTILAIILGFLPGLAWLFFYLQEDIHPEPKKLIFLTFIMGAVSAVFALGVEISLKPALGGIGMEKLTLSSLVVLALIEELLKFGAAYFSVHKNPAFDEPVDAMIYMVIAALGFATVENLGAVTSGSPSQTAILSDAFTTTSLRFVGATLLHSLTSALIGYYWALGIREFKTKKYILFGLLLASGLHSVFNYLIIAYGNVLYTAVFLVLVGFFVLNDFEKLKRRII